MGNIDSLLFRPPETTPLHPNCRFWLTTAYGNRIPAVYFKRENAKITFLYSHANAEDLGLMFSWLKCLSRRLNVNVLAYDYTGYGESDGMCHQLLFDLVCGESMPRFGVLGLQSFSPVQSSH
jgi:hypothetical protein